MYSFDAGDGAWRLLGALDADGGRDIHGFGWFGLGYDREPGSCVEGALLDHVGAPIAGAVVEVVADGVFGPLRGASDPSGAFCVDVPSDRALRLHLFGALPSGEELVADALDARAQGSGSCGGRCTALGDLVPQVFPDVDGDGYPAGFGDCNDFDEAVNPRVFDGDGSICTVAL
jgi:hypothetical protein